MYLRMWTPRQREAVKAKFCRRVFSTLRFNPIQTLFMQHGLILFAHGSRDPLWRAPLEGLATAIARELPTASVQCAYLELCEPNLENVVSEMVAQGVTQIKILPMFFGIGKHAREDLPELVRSLRAAWPALRLECEPAVGEHPLLKQAIVAIATQAS
jgi:sirohydrochlorin cobaltochelatase